MTELPPNPALRPLRPFVGTWDVEVPRFPGQHGRATFEWLEGGAYLRFHAVAPDPAPSATLIVSRDEESDDYTVFHYDSRGVSRVYQMSFDGRVWRQWRAAPGFHQRLAGTFSDDGDTIQATWEKSPDGVTWEKDFDLTYTRVG